MLFNFAVNHILRDMRKGDEKIHCINTNRHDSGIFHPEKAGITVKNELVYKRCKYVWIKIRNIARCSQDILRTRVS